MADDNRSSREIERELEQERAELRGTIDQLLGRLTFEDAWEQTGRYLRENRSEYGHTLGRMVKEKPIALALTAVGIGWLLFGPASPAASRARDARTLPPRHPYDADRDLDSRRSSSGVDPAETLPRASEVNAARGSTSGTRAETGLSGAGTGGSAAPPASRSATGPTQATRSASSVPSGGVGTTSPSTARPGATSTSGTASTSTGSEATKDRPLGAPPGAATTASTHRSGGLEKGDEVRDPSAPSSTPSSVTETRPQRESGSSGDTDDENRKPST